MAIIKDPDRVRVPSERETLSLMKRHGDPVDHDNRFGWVYQFSVEGMQELINEWLTRQAAAIKRRKRTPDLLESDQFGATTEMVARKGAK